MNLRRKQRRRIGISFIFIIFGWLIFCGTVNGTSVIFPFISDNWVSVGISIPFVKKESVTEIDSHSNRNKGSAGTTAKNKYDNRHNY